SAAEARSRAGAPESRCDWTARRGGVNVRPIVAVVGNRDATRAQCELAEDVGRLLVERGFRVLTGGLSGVMEAACRGARSASNWREGDVIGILPGSCAEAANPYVDIVIPSG